MSARGDQVEQAVRGKHTNASGWARGNCPFCYDRAGKEDRKACLGLNRRNGWYHCFAGETRVLTWGGYEEIRSLAGRTVRVLTAGPTGLATWVDAPFETFGRQRLLTVHLTRNGVHRRIRATPEHRWFVRSKPWREVTTEQLKHGHRLRPVAPPRSGTTLVSPWGAAHGIAFGDGTRRRGGVLVNLWGAKDSPLRRFFPLSPQAPASRGQLKGVRVDGLPRFFKELPSIDESPAYLLGWLAGYFAADGCVDTTGVPKLASASRANIEFVRRVCLRVGVFCYEPTMQMRTGYDTAPTALYSIVFGRSSLSEAFFLIEEHRRRWLLAKTVEERRGWVVDRVEDAGEEAEVFCATVPGTHAFALEGHILTGNCFRCGTAGRIDGYEDSGDDEPEAPRPVITAPPNFERLYEGTPDPFLAPPARAYLERERLLPVPVLKETRVGACFEGRYRGRVVVPVMAPDGDVWLGWVARAYFEGAQRPYLYPSGANLRAVLFNHSALFLETEKPVMVVEGVFDAMALWPDAVAVLGKPGEAQVEALMAANRPVVFVLDGDAWREAWALAARFRVEGLRAGYVRLAAGRDPDEVDRAVLEARAVRALDARL